MPTYEYECPAGHRYETREGFDAPAKQKCQVCGKVARRVLFAPPIVFKGSGFYVTDSRKSESSASSSSNSSDGASTSETKSDSASDGKADTKSDSGKSDSSSTKDSGSTTKADTAAASS